MGGLQRTPPGSSQRSQRIRRQPPHLDAYEVGGGGNTVSPPHVIGGVSVVHTPHRPPGGRGRRATSGLGERPRAADFWTQPEPSQDVVQQPEEGLHPAEPGVEEEAQEGVEPGPAVPVAEQETRIEDEGLQLGPREAELGLAAARTAEELRGRRNSQEGGQQRQEEGERVGTVRPRWLENLAADLVGGDMEVHQEGEVQVQEQVEEQVQEVGTGMALQEAEVLQDGTREVLPEEERGEEQVQEEAVLPQGPPRRDEEQGAVADWTQPIIPEAEDPREPSEDGWTEIDSVGG